MGSIVKSAGVRGVSCSCQTVTECFKRRKARTQAKKRAHLRVPFPIARPGSMGVLGLGAAFLVTFAAAGLAVEDLVFHRLAAAFRAVVVRAAALVGRAAVAAVAAAHVLRALF